MGYRKKSNNGVKMVIFFFFVIAIAGTGYIYTAEEFEREVPVIESQKSLFWNKVKPLEITIKDNVSLKNFIVTLSDGNKSIIIENDELESNTKKETVLVRYPKDKGLNPHATKLQLHIVATDNSLWHFMQGNSSEKYMDIILDYKRPNVNILSHSYLITQGGSALVIFQADDENLEKIYVEAGGVKFKAQPYQKEGFYAALIAWPFNHDEFVANIVAIDVAGNKRVVDIPYYIKNYEYRVSWIHAKDTFIDGKITDLASASPEYAGIDDKLERLRAINEKMRLENEKLIHSLSENVSTEILTSWEIKKFYPLRNGQRVASYGDERHYYYKTKDNVVSHSYHVGYDLASTKMASIKTSNAGKIVYSSDNGIYGNMPMVDHGLGLYSLYGHCSQVLVNDGDEVKAGDTIAKTGVSGLALGDHLHFGLLVQGIEVRPVEWFDTSWIRKNIDNIFKEADKIIMGN